MVKKLWFVESLGNFFVGEGDSPESVAVSFVRQINDLRQFGAFIIVSNTVVLNGNYTKKNSFLFKTPEVLYIAGLIDTATYQAMTRPGFGEY